MGHNRPSPLPRPLDPFLLIDEDLIEKSAGLSEQSAELVRQHCYSALRDLFVVVPHSRHGYLFTAIVAAIIDEIDDPRDLLPIFARCCAQERSGRC